MGYEKRLVTTSAPWKAAYFDRAMQEEIPEEIPDPVEPDSGRWRLVCSTASSARLFWFWEREESQ